jgi:hypothetical protein
MLKAFLGHWQPRRRGWYDGWMIHDITVPNIAAPRKDSRAQFGTITQPDAAILQKMGTGNNVRHSANSASAATPTDGFKDKSRLSRG